MYCSFISNLWVMTVFLSNPAVIPSFNTCLLPKWDMYVVVQFSVLSGMTEFLSHPTVLTEHAFTVKVGRKYCRFISKLWVMTVF